MNNEKLFYDNVLFVTPMTKRFAVNPGDTVEGVVTVVNPTNTSESITYQASVIPYSFNENGEPVFDEVGELSEIVNWVTIENPTGEIEPNSDIQIKYKIKIPKEARGGGQYCAISIRNETPVEARPEGLQIDSYMEISSIIYMTVNGDIEREGEIVENYVPLISFENPVTLRSSYDNHGNIHLDSNIKVSVENFFTHEPLFSSDDQEDQSIVVMPNQLASKLIKVTDLTDLGLYRIKQEVRYNGESSIVERVTLVTPMWFFACATALVISTIVLLVVRAIRRSKRWW